MTTPPQSPASWIIEPRDLPDNGGTHFRILPAVGQDAIARTFAGPEQESIARLLAPAPALEDTLETLLDVFLDGRIDGLDEKELAAYERADAALKATKVLTTDPD